MYIVLISHPNFLDSQSMPRFENMLRNALISQGNTVIALSPKAFFYKIPFPSKFKKWLGYIDQYLLFPIFLYIKINRSPKNALFVFTDNALGPWVPLASGRPHVIHCHDFLAQKSAKGEILENRIGITGKLYQKLIRRGFNKGKYFISVSNKTKEDLHYFFEGEPVISEVVYNSINRDLSLINKNDFIAFFKSKYNINIDNGFILHVGGNQWYKNREGVILIYENFRKLYDFNIPLVLIGQKPSIILLDIAKKSEYFNEILFIEKADDIFVNTAYTLATLLLFPSLNEGFGWPIAESIILGCPVLTTNIGPMNEVGGDIANYIPRMPFDFKDRIEWAKNSAIILNEIIKSKEENKEILTKHQKINTQLYEKDTSIFKYLEVYKKVIEIEI